MRKVGDARRDIRCSASDEQDQTLLIAPHARRDGQHPMYDRNRVSSSWS